MMRRAALLALLLGASTVAAEEHVVGQKDRQFRSGDTKLVTLAVKAGDTVTFRNDDRFAHNVVSRTPGQEFDLGMLRPGESGKRSFATPGTVEVECALHPQMKFRIEVAQ
jgi:plastocyanin